MKFKQLVKKIKQDSWWSEDMPSNYQLTICAWRSFIIQNHVYKQKFLSVCFALYKNDLVLEKTSEQEKLQQFCKVLSFYSRNPARVENFYNDYKKIQAKLIKTGEWAVRNRKNFSDEQLAGAYRKVYDLAVLHFANSVIPEASDVYSDQKLLKDLKKVLPKFSDSDLLEASLTLSTYPMLSFMERERLDFLKEGLKSRPDFEKFSKRYHWVQNNYTGAKNLSEDYFKRSQRRLSKEKQRKEIFSEIKSLEEKAVELKKRQIKLLKELKLPAKVAQLFNFLRIMSRWIDERKFGALHMIYYVDKLVEEASIRTKIHEEFLDYYTPEEIINLLQKKIKISVKIAKERQKFSVVATTYTKEGFKEQVFLKKQAQVITKAFQRRETKVVKGFAASAPVDKISGKVQVIINPHKEKFIPGRILVTTMTRPDFVPLMRKAIAIITDEGGITSHAAIISRELGIPCIIGTKVASKILKTGDKVELDVKNGAVRKI